MVKIRRMTLDDVPHAARLEKENFSDPWSEQSFREEVQNPDALYLVACEDEQVLGICGLLISYDEGDVLNVSVSDKARRRGIGEAMLKELMLQGKQRGVNAFTLEVRKGNQPAIALYEKLGFVSEGVRPNFYRNPTEDAVIYWKRDDII